MKSSLHDYMKVGLIHFMAYPFAASGDGDIARTIEEIAVDDFFDAIEITRINDVEQRKIAKSIIDTAGMTVGFGAQPYILKGKLNLNSTDEQERAKAVEVLKEAVDQAYEMGARKFGFLSGPKPATGQDEALALLATPLTRFGRNAASRGDLTLPWRPSTTRPTSAPSSAPIGWRWSSRERFARPFRTSV